ncbi:sigma-E processing peptidase SpoIIGA [uncultured Clostridium sp.]|uniref:sigma-E processing peptidase SpoIIGA n=1 Tax=uncultured Clostridium sp. TaxID=59620 RepID=UPI0028ECEF7A|nr:sigma-E processing peptidase SpoIIGA [uncultured Clostridium sp.]
MVIYLDVFLLENFIVNTFLIFLTSDTLKIRAKKLNVLIGALVGTLYTITLFLKSLNLFINVPVKIIMALIMILISFRKKNILFNLKATAIFILYSMLLAGLCVFIEFNKSGGRLGYGIIINFSYKKLMIALMLIYLILRRVVFFIKDRKVLNSYIYGVEIVLDSSVKKIRAFLDTGNELVEPVTNLPVIIVEENLFTKEEIKNYKYYYIPYNVINGSHGRLEAIKPEKIIIYKEDSVEEKEALIAFCHNKLSGEDDYQGLLSRGIL